jgi:N-acetylmuramoyl-L-alanine amidase
MAGVHRCNRIFVVALLFCVLPFAGLALQHHKRPTTPSTAHRSAARPSKGPRKQRQVADALQTPYEHALHLRAQLDATTPGRRTARQYDETVDAFRAVYHADRADLHADSSVEAVAELLAQEGRERNDPALLHAALDQLEFLRRDWSASRFSIPALLTEGEIADRDLQDKSLARQHFSEFLAQYPHSTLASQARAELRRLGGRLPVVDVARATPNTQLRTAGQLSDAGSTAAQQPHKRAPQTPRLPRSAAAQESAPVMAKGVENSPQVDNWTPPTSAASPAHSDTVQSDAAQSGPAPFVPRASSEAVPRNPASIVSGVPVYRGGTPDPPSHAGQLALVTGVRQWSTASYTRIAIDLQDEVPYEASRVSNPDRIFFDFHGARLAPQLAGKAVSVTDGGFLQRIRAAQFSGDVVRVVLDVTDVSDYSAFWLPNPSRLIIDIHGRPKGAPPLAFANATPSTPLSLKEPSPAHSNRADVDANSPSQASRADFVKEADVPPPHTLAARAAASGRPTPRAARAAAPGTFVADTTAPGADDNLATQSGDSVAAIAALSQQSSRVRATPVAIPGPVSPAISTASARATSVARLDKAGQSDQALADVPPGTAPVSDESGRKRARHGRAAVQPATTDTAPRNDVDKPETPGFVAQAAAPDATGGRSMVRALGLKINRIVVDAGHGGHDSGTLGPGGIEEKDVVLDVALRLGKLLKQRLGADVIYTRDDDTFVPLETRTAIANKAQADLFISIHANSSPDADARGVETYYLNFTTSADALEVAARENAVSDESIHQLSDLVKKITLQDKIAESREFASDVEGSLYQGLENGNPGLKDRGVKKAPFVVLIGANMPSILAEISFLTNPQDAVELREGAYRQRIAESVYRGVARYVHSLSSATAEERASTR